MNINFKLSLALGGALLISGCSLPESRQVLDHHKDATSTFGVVISSKIKIQVPLPIDASETKVPVTSDSTAGIEFFRGVWGKLNGSSRHRVYTEVQYQGEDHTVGTIDLPESAKQKYEPGDKIQILSDGDQRTAVNLSQRARLGLVAPPR